MRTIALLFLCLSANAAELFPVTMRSWVDAPNGVVTIYDPKDGNAPFTLAVAPYVHPGSTRKNHCLSWGYNVNTGGALNGNEWACMFTIEPFYSPVVGVEYLEWHLPQIWSPVSHQMFRPLSFIVDRNTERIEGAIRAAKFSFLDQAGVQRLIIENGNVNLNGSAIVFHQPAGTPLIYGLNAARTTFHQILRRDTHDNVHLYGGVTSTYRVLTDINFSTSQKKYRTVSVIGGVTVDVSTESQWE